MLDMKEMAVVRCELSDAPEDNEEWDITEQTMCALADSSFSKCRQISV